MKTTFFSIIILIAFSFTSINGFAQIRKIPAEVTEAMKEKYPDAQNISWRDKLAVFVASFEMNNGKYEARFNDKGEWKSTEMEIAENDLGQEVKDGFEKCKYSDWQILNVYQIDLPNDEMQFRILVSKNDIQKRNLLFNSEGKLLKDNYTLKDK